MCDLRVQGLGFMVGGFRGSELIIPDRVGTS